MNRFFAKQALGASLPIARAVPHLRPVRPGDADAFQQFVMRLSAQSRRLRFHCAINSCSPGMLASLTQPDSASHQAWVAVQTVDGQQAIVGEARFVASSGRDDAELAIAIADEQRGRGVADRLLRTVIDAARRAAVQVLFGDVLEGNSRMFGLLQRHGFEVHRSAGVDPGLVRWRRRLLPAT